jgi:hypothetical protein
LGVTTCFVQQKGVIRGFPKFMQKRKNTFEARKGSKQRTKLEEDARPQKVMREGTKPLGVVNIGVVMRHVPTKPQKH